MVASVQSGGAPLAPRLATLVEQAEATFKGDVRRAVVIDAEGSTFDILESFSKRGRVIVTPLRPSRAPELELRYTQGSYFRPYRENDELRVATASLTHKSTGRSINIGALIVRREHRKSDTVLLTTGLAHGMEGRDLADLYFSRWPVQENAFKEGTAVGLDEHCGNCGRMVNNVTVITELERIERRMAGDEKKRRNDNKQTEPLERALEEKQREHQRAAKLLATRRYRLDNLITQGHQDGKQLGRATVEHQQALIRAETAQRDFEAAQQKLTVHHERLKELEATLEKLAKRRKQLEPQRRIRQLDVAQDSILTATKLTALQLIAFALREYLPSLPMTPQTFISRVFSIPGRCVLRPGKELVVFYENTRDPAMNAALRDACTRLNSRKLKRNGRVVQYAVEEHAKRRHGTRTQFD
jgi:hypothetical protein